MYSSQADGLAVQGMCTTLHQPLAERSRPERSEVEKEPTSWKHHAQLGCTARHCLHVLAPLVVQTLEPVTETGLNPPKLVFLFRSFTLYGDFQSAGTYFIA